jgi:hypothetical protein
VAVVVSTAVAVITAAPKSESAGTPG